MARTGRDIIRIEQKREAFIEDAIGRVVRLNQKRLEEPGGVRAMPFGRAGVRHRLDCLVLGGERRRASLGLTAHATEGFDPARSLGLRRDLRVLQGNRHHDLREKAEPCPAPDAIYGIVSAMCRGAESKFRDECGEGVTRT
jgi:hypothetical protein